MSPLKNNTYNVTNNWLEETDTSMDTLTSTQARKKGKKTRRPPQLIPQHDDIYGKKNKHAMQIYFNNINGISSNNE
eukprot:126385-Ditylum_brightwellii.AAC.1